MAAKVLICDDEELVREMLKEMLLVEDLEAVCAETGDETRALLREHRDEIRLLITDVILPETDGISLAMELSLDYPNLKTLFISGYDRETLQAKGFDLGSQRLIQKPFETDEFLRSVRSLIG